jgi:hypothetical protein
MAGRMKVISFCLWGNDPKYMAGALANARLATALYPGWACWFYCRNDTDGATMLTLSQLDNCEVIFVDKAGDWTGMFDRFYPGCGPDVEVFISRDCDSRLTAREAAAVEEWLASDKGFHCMVPVLGGMWGMKEGTVPHFQALLENWPQEDRWQTDQEFLTNSIWPMVRGNIMCHDAGFLSSHFGGGRPFPTPRLESGEFVGATYDADGVIDAGQVAELKRILG